MARLAAVDLAELAAAEIATVPGGSRTWQASGLPLVASPKDSRDAERVDYLFWNHDRRAGNPAAMRAYLRWETELPAQIAADGQAGGNYGVDCTKLKAYIPVKEIGNAPASNQTFRSVLPR
ncbi:MAG: hypothetical protein WA184_25545 [Stellaceae bacterium]